MKPVNRSSTDDLVCSMPDDLLTPTPTGGATRTDRAPSSSVESFRRPANEDQPVGDDSRLEALLREKFSALSPRESYELSGKGEASNGISGELSGKVRVERLEDGRFKVQVEANAEGGGGARVLGNARFNIGSGTTFIINNAAEAADLVDALAKHTAVAQTNALLAAGVNALHTVAGMEGDVVDAAARIRGYGPRLGEAKLELGGKVQLGDEFKESLAGFEAELKAKVTLGGKASVTIDPEKGEVRFTSTITVDGAAKAKLPLGMKLGADAKVSVSIVQTSKIPPRAIDDFRAGRISAADAALQAGPISKVTAQGEIEMKGQGAQLGSADIKVKLKTELSVDNTGIATDPMRLAEFLASAKFSLEADVGYGGKVSVDAGAGKFELTAMQRTKSEPYSKKLFSLGEAANKAAQFIDDGSTQCIEARRASYNLL